MQHCPICGRENLASAFACGGCAATLERPAKAPAQAPRIWSRIATCVLVCVALIAAFYVSLISSAKGLTLSESSMVSASIDLLEQKGYKKDAFLLRHVAVFRSTDNWLNSTVAKENAYAATNFPFEVITLYPDFFTYPLDDTERAAILLHEAQHLKGADEPEAYAFVWKARHDLGWFGPEYESGVVLPNVRRQTREAAPHLFVCTLQRGSDCTETFP